MHAPAELEPRHRMIQVRPDLSLHVETWGYGPPLVLLHGFTGSTATWAPLRAVLGARHTLVAVDLPGHGRSSAPDDLLRYAMPFVADDLLCVLDELRMPRVSMLGYSMGGRAALWFAARHTSRLDALVIESASPGLAEEDRGMRLTSDEALAAALVRDGIEAFVDRWEALPLWASQRQLPGEVREQLRAQRLANDARGLANSLRGAGAGAEASLMPRLAALDVPVQLIAGALDAKYVTIAREVAAVLPDARLTVVGDAGHAVHLEQPEAFAAAVTSFLDAR